MHLHVTDAFEAESGRRYIGSRDIDLGVYVAPSWDVETLREKPASTTLSCIENEIGYNRGRFGFYQYFHRLTKERLSDEQAAEYPQHQIFRVDIDILPSTDDLDVFDEAFGFQPPSEPLLEPVFTDDTFETLNRFVEWDAPNEIRLVPGRSLRQ